MNTSTEVSNIHTLVLQNCYFDSVLISSLIETNKGLRRFKHSMSPGTYLDEHGKVARAHSDIYPIC